MTDSVTTIRAPAPDLDSLLREFETATNLAQPEEPAGPDAVAEARARAEESAVNLAEITQRNAARWAELREHIRPQLEQLAQIRTLEQQQQLIADTKAQHGLTDIPDELVAATIESGNENAFAALQQLDDNYRSNAMLRGIEAAQSAVRNISSSDPLPVRFDGAKAARMSDAEWDSYKAELVAAQQGRR